MSGDSTSTRLRLSGVREPQPPTYVPFVVQRDEAAPHHKRNFRVGALHATPLRATRNLLPGQSHCSNRQAIGTLKISSVTIRHRTVNGAIMHEHRNLNG